MKYLPIGSISHGTMREEDLLPALLYAIEDHDQLAGTQFNEELISEGFGYSQCGACGLGNRDEWPEDFDASTFIDSMFDYLDEHCPPYCYFGSHPGDGSDYGCWPCDDIQQMMRDEGLYVGEDHPDDDYSGEWLQINDHGNMTLWLADGKGNNSEIWSIV